MKVLFDYQAFEWAYGGVPNCFVELIAHLPKECQWEIGVEETSCSHLWEYGLIPDLKLSKLNFDNFILKRDFKGKTFLYRSVNKMFPCFPSSTNINRKYSLKRIQKGDYDVFHATYNDDYFCTKLQEKTFVITIHDMTMELFPEYFPNRGFKQEMQKKMKLAHLANHIIAVSENTKRDIVNLYGINKDKITVIHHGYPDFRKYEIKERIIPVRYILYVGKRNGYKQFVPFLKEFARFAKEYKDIKLVCTGSPFTKEEMGYIKKFGIEECVFSKYVNYTDLQNLYHYAFAFVYPSLYEGFGMPILEAFSQHCPVLLNRTSCFPEIGGNAALYFEMNSERNNLYDILCVLSEMDEKDRQGLTDRGYERLSLFSWQKASQALVNCYNKII